MHGPDPTAPDPRTPDPLGRVLEWGLVAVLILAPLPFGSVLPGALGLLEAGSLLLLVVWMVRAARRPTPLPPRWVRVGLGGLLILGLVQALPLGRGPVAWLSPVAWEIREESRPPAEARAAEEDLLGGPVERLEGEAALSVDPGSSASALRTGAALAALLLVATTVAATRGFATLAAALLVSAAFQALYGTLVLASGHDMIWHVAKRHYLDSATGTFVNRNHFAGYLAAALCCGTGLVLERVARARRGARRARRRWLDLTGPEGARTLLLGLMVVVGLGGLLLSFSRAGIAIGLVTLGALLLRAGPRRLPVRLALLAILVAAAAVPLSQIGTGRLAERYARTARDFAAPGGRATVWSDTLGMAATFPVAGSGFGTFSTAYPLFRSPEVRLFFRHAHNDALQFAAEGGIAGTLLLLLVLAPVLARVPRALGGGGPPLGAGLALGLLAILAHALVDFPFHVPSSAATAAVLAGTMLGYRWNARG